MDLRILGASGGISPTGFTSSYLINNSLLLDAGTGLQRLNLEEQQQIRQVFISHAHLDHICCLPLLLDNHFHLYKEQPLEVYALPEVISILRQHLFNWQLWPDFTCLPTPEQPVVRLIPVELGQKISFPSQKPNAATASLEIQPFAVDHVVPTSGFFVVSKNLEQQPLARLAYTSDTTLAPVLIESLNQLGHLDLLITECAFTNSMSADLAAKAKHLTPKLLKQLLSELKFAPKLLGITHFKPSLEEQLQQEIAALNLSQSTIYLHKTDKVDLLHDI